MLNLIYTDIYHAIAFLMSVIFFRQNKKLNYLTCIEQRCVDGTF